MNYQYTNNGKEIVEWIPSIYGKPLLDCLDEARNAGLTWDAAGLPESGEPRRVTKLTIKRRLEALGKWDTFKVVMAQMPAAVQDEWALAQEIREDDPMFLANRAALLAALGITEEQLGGLFA